MANKQPNKKFDMKSIDTPMQEMFSKKNAFMKLYIILGVISVVIAFFAIYFGLLQFSLHSSGFKFIIVFLLLIWSIPAFVKFRLKKLALTNNNLDAPVNKWYNVVPFFTALGLIAIYFILSICTMPIFMAKSYRGLITVNENGNFATEIEDYSEMQIPIVDKDLAIKLGEKRLGEDNLGSQYTINDYTMITYKNGLYWVGAIEYDGFFKWTSERGSGSPGYILISATSLDDVTLVKEPFFYMPNAYLNEDLERKMYFTNMGLVRDGRINFELDENGTPYYTQAVIQNRFAFSNGSDCYGLYVLNAKTGDCKYYDSGKQPEWVDRVIPTEIALNQIDYWGAYKHGFFNTMFSKKEVLQISDGYNYIYHNGDLWLYTGVTSVGKDESIVGAVLCNLKDKTTDFYPISGATEYAARQSAQGAVQNYGFQASFPCLINYGGTPTYFMVLKDSEGLIKQYAYVNVTDYTKVGIGDSIEKAQQKYNEVINIAVQYENYTISDIRQVEIDGSSVYYIKFNECGDNVYKASVKLNDKLPFAVIGTQVEVRISGSIVSEIRIN